MANAQAPSTIECAAAADSLAAGGRNYMFWQQLPECGPAGVAALAGAVENAAQETNTEYLMMLLGRASEVMDPWIIEVAGELVGNEAAQTAARIMGIMLLAKQYSRSFAIVPPLRFDDLVNGPVAPCPIGASIAGDYVARSPLPSDSLAMFSGPLDQARSESQPARVRDLAACLRGKLSIDIPIVVPTHLIGMGYRCGNRFVIENGSRDWLFVTVTIDGTTESVDMTIPPHR